MKNNNTFNALEYLHDNNSEALKRELEKYDIKELKKIYNHIATSRLTAKMSKDRVLLIEGIVEQGLRILNMGWVFSESEKHFV